MSGTNVNLITKTFKANPSNYESYVYDIENRLIKIEKYETNQLVKRSMYSYDCLLYTSPSPRDRTRSRMPSSA